MNTLTSPLHLAIPEDDVPPMPTGVEPIIKVNRKPPARFAVDRGDGLEPVLASDEADVRTTIKKQVVSGNIGIVYIYALVGAEVLVPTAVSMTLEEIADKITMPGE